MLTITKKAVPMNEDINYDSNTGLNPDKPYNAIKEVR